MVGGGGGTLPGVGGVGGAWKSGASAGTVPAAAHCGMPVLGFSVITNMAAGIVKEATLSHEEVASTMAVVNERFSDYLEEVIGSI